MEYYDCGVCGKKECTRSIVVLDKGGEVFICEKCDDNRKLDRKIVEDMQKPLVTKRMRQIANYWETTGMPVDSANIKTENRLVFRKGEYEVSKEFGGLRHVMDDYVFGRGMTKKVGFCVQCGCGVIRPEGNTRHLCYACSIGCYPHSPCCEISQKEYSEIRSMDGKGLSGVI